MSSAEPCKIQFINLDPSQTSTASQRRIHSHAAREAHARTRRLRVMEHQAYRSAQQSKDGDKENNMALANRNPVQPELLVVPSPVSLLASDRRDPFMSFANPFTPIEHFLFQHCESEPPPQP